MNINQISVFLENRKGQLAEITRLLADNGIDMRAISIAETADYGILRIIVDDTQRASDILHDNGNILTLTPVTVVGVTDEPAALSKLLTLLAGSGVDIVYMYSLFTHTNGKAYMVFRVADKDKLSEVLKANGITKATKDELGLK
ncbi:MAG: ACT domain-containing protein [Clostridia bacterium]|nr:ACT domain-containing protein [Clostridia bacterium]